MRSSYKIFSSETPYFLTATIVNWISIFTKQRYFQIIIDALEFSRKTKNLKVLAFVILDNHIHLILQHPELAKVFKEFKQFTARKIIKTLNNDNNEWMLNELSFWKKKHKTNSNFQVWQESSHPQEIFAEDVFLQKLEYIHNNPIKRGFVRKPEYWKFSSAINYIEGNEKGEIEIDLFE